jgi:hypothetical protein
VKGRDIISDYFDRGSDVYAPIKRDGKTLPAKMENFDVASRTAPLTNINNIISLEYTIPRSLMNDNDASSGKVAPVLLSKTAPVGGKENPLFTTARVKAAEHRLTSAAQRNLRQTKRDIEEMHQILVKRKYDQNVARLGGGNTTGAGGSNTAGTPGSPSRGGATGNLGATGGISSLLAKKPKGRPPTPDLTRDRTQVYVPPEDEDSSPVLQSNTPQPIIEEISPFKFDHEFQLAVILLQRLIRGRAVQNIMFEGKYRRRELIEELKNADIVESEYEEPSAIEQEGQRKIEREERIRETTYDTIAGSTSIGLLHALAQEKVSCLLKTLLLGMI